MQERRLLARTVTVHDSTPYCLYLEAFISIVHAASCKPHLIIRGQTPASKYRIAGYFRGRNILRISRIFAVTRKYYSRKKVDVIASAS